jgi:hypothetical protein
MLLAFAMIKSFIPEWNQRPMTEADFWRICRRLKGHRKVKVHEIPLSVPGFYMSTPHGGAHIYINSNLRGMAWLLAAFHELGHHLMHAPPDVTVAYFYQQTPNTKEDLESDAFKIICVLPEPLLRRLLTENASEYLAGGEVKEDGEVTASCYGFTMKLIKERLKVLETYGL